MHPYGLTFFSGTIYFISLMRLSLCTAGVRQTKRKVSLFELIRLARDPCKGKAGDKTSRGCIL